MKKELYDKVYRLLRDVTPLKADCGTLCDKNCCRGDEGMGMLLFPREETELSVIEKNGRRLAVCGGTCDRYKRPLSCRIFPFFPAVKDGEIYITPDYRGINICPMVAHCDEIVFSRRFFRRLEKAGKILYEDKDCAEFMEEITEEIEDAREINRIFGD